MRIVQKYIFISILRTKKYFPHLIIKNFSLHAKSHSFILKRVNYLLIARKNNISYSNY